MMLYSDSDAKPARIYTGVVRVCMCVCRAAFSVETRKTLPREPHARKTYMY